jgi:hypothetical protein
MYRRVNTKEFGPSLCPSFLHLVSKVCGFVVDNWQTAFLNIAGQLSSMALSGVCRATARSLVGGRPKLSTRLLSSSAPARKEGESKPPRPIDDSTSALDYKKFQRHRPPPLPAVELPRSRSAEEAVTNILYNTPPPSNEPFKKYACCSHYEAH